MPTGLQILNDSGTIQITESYVGFGLRHKGTITLSLDGGSHPNPLYVAQITVAGSKPILAIQANQMVSVRQGVQSGGNWTFYLISNSAATVTYYVFDEAQYAQNINDNFGLAVYKADGSLAFHSSMKPLRIVGVKQASPPDGFSGSFEGVYFTEDILTNGRNYAVVTGTYCFRSEMWNETETDYGELPVGKKWMQNRTMGSMSKVVNNVVQTDLSAYESYYNAMPSSANEIGFTHGAIMFWIIDVTNY